MSDPAAASLARARAALELGRPEEALREAGLALAADPTSEEPHALVTRALFALDRLVEAERAAAAGIAARPESEWLHRLRAIALAWQERHADALAAADEAVRLLPGSAQAHHVRALALAGLVRTDDARAAARAALALDPDDADLHRHLGDLHLDEDPAAGERHYRAALALEPNDVACLNNLGVSLRAQGRLAEAVHAFKSAVLLDPTLAEAKRNTHSTVAQLVKTAPALAGAGGLAALKALFVGSGALRWPDLGALLAAGAGAAALVVGGTRLGELHRRRKLAARDPQLYALYRQLDADHRRGRL